jgi:hypothetical protein
MAPKRQGDEAGTPSKRGRIAELGPGWISAISALIAALVGAIGLFIAFSSDGGSADDSTRESGNATRPVEAGVLPPAAIPPVVSVCSEQLFIAVNGTVSPLTCPDGSLNVRAWQHHARTDRFVMRLGPDATPEDVGRAMCSDLDRAATTIPQEEEAYRLAAIYYGWDYALNPSDFFPENCS